MKTIEERIMEVGAKVLDEMLLHKTDVVVTMKSSGSEFSVYVDVHPVTMFSNYEREELEYKAQREGLSEEGKRQLDRTWEMKKELDKEKAEREVKTCSDCKYYKQISNSYEGICSKGHGIVRQQPGGLPLGYRNCHDEVCSEALIKEKEDERRTE